MISALKARLIGMHVAPQLMKFSELKYWNNEKQMVNRLEDVLKEHLPEKVLSEVRTMLYGAETPSIEISEDSKKIAMENKFDIEGYKIPCAMEQNRKPRLVRIGAIQNSIQAPTTVSIKE